MRSTGDRQIARPDPSSDCDGDTCPSTSTGKPETCSVEPDGKTLLDVSTVAGIVDEKREVDELSFRFLCPDGLAGRVIECCNSLEIASAMAAVA